MSEFLKRAIGVALLSGTIAFAYANEITFERTEVTSPLLIGNRKRITESPMIYARIQPYDLYSNYLQRWIDRPLFLYREWRNDADGGRARGFSRDMEVAMEYDIDGFTMLGNAYENRYKNYLALVESNAPENFSFMPGLSWTQRLSYQRYLENARLGLASKYSPRVNGKVPFFSYVTMPLESIRKIRDRLAEDGCADILLFDNISVNVWNDYSRHGKLSPKTIGTVKKQFQDKLDVVDGLIFTNYHMHRNPLGDYTLSKKFIFDLDANHVRPVIEEIYSKPENRDKLLGFNIRHGYIGHMSGTNEGEYGTEQLRQAMDTALVYNPDIISLVEWNEANENTSFQPTIYNGKSMQRVIRFYARKMKGLPTQPNPGDDLSIPNLIVSVRQVLGLGEKYRIELLNVPDSDEDKVYQVQVTLKDQDGRTICVLPSDSFTVKNLTAITYTIPSESMPRVKAVIPELRISGAGYAESHITTLQYPRLTPSVCWNYKEVRQPLREMLIPRQAAFNVTGCDTGKAFLIHGAITAGEPLASVEILNHESEVFAVDRDNEFGLDQNHLLRIGFSCKNPKLREVNIQIPGVDSFIFKPWSFPYAGFGNWTKSGDTVKGRLLFFGHGVQILLAIPRDRIDAVVKFDIEGLGCFEIPVRKVIEQGVIGLELPELHAVRVERMDKLADHPVTLNQNSAEFSARINSEFTLPCFQLRAVAVSGRIYRSKPIFPAELSGDTEKINVFSSSAGNAVTMEVPRETITEINYAFSPEYGTVLRDPANPYFDGQLGGGFKYLDPMRTGQLPDNVILTAPTWGKSGSGWQLDFDGQGNYLILPIETIPTGSFTLEFECMTASGENQVLLRHYSYRPGSLLMYIIDGKLQAEFASMGNNYREKENKLEVNLPFPVNKWLTVRVTYNLKNIIFEVDGKKAVLPFALRAAKPTSASFGGFTLADRDITGKDLKFFKGSLRSFRVRHNAEAR